MDSDSSRWNDDRLDEVVGTIDRRFDQVDRRFDRIEDRMDSRFGHVDHELTRVNDRLDDLVHVIVGGFIALTCGIVAGFVAMTVLVATQI